MQLKEITDFRMYKQTLNRRRFLAGGIGGFGSDFIWTILAQLGNNLTSGEKWKKVKLADSLTLFRTFNYDALEHMFVQMFSSFNKRMITEYHDKLGYFKKFPVLNEFNCFLVGGFFSGTIGHFFVHPLEVAKTHIKVNKGSLLPTLKQVYAKNGFKSLYSGYGLACSYIGPFNAWKTAIGFLGKKYYQPLLWKPNLFEYIMILTSAAQISFTIHYPIQVIRERTQKQVMMGDLKKQICQTWSQIYANEGCSGLYKGFWIASLKRFTTSFIKYTFRESLKDYWDGIRKKEKLI